MSDYSTRLRSILGISRSTPAAPLSASERRGPPIRTAKSTLEDLGFLVLAPGIHPIVDIIAIHGLEGHREHTWVADNGVLWLRDFLPGDLPNARVLTYGYDADTRSSECVSTQTMGRHAEAFLHALSRHRKDCSRRPIIFIAHDLGGIILKWALVICHNQSLETRGNLRDIIVSTHAILFFGVPHHGVEYDLQEAIKRLVSVHLKVKNVILKDLRSHSSELEYIQSLYVEASKTISTIFFCPEYAESQNVNTYVAHSVGPTKDSTVFLHANHLDLTKFSSRSSDNYQTVLFYLRSSSESASKAVYEQWLLEDNLRNIAKEEIAILLPKPLPPVSRGYVDRTKIQSQITQMLIPSTRIHQPRCILHGNGGGGKTQLAVNWIREHETRYTRVIFVDASSQSQLEADMERSIRCLGPEYSNMTWRDAVRYLDGEERGWLLLVDGADSPDLDLHPYLPVSTHGTLIITTRNGGSVNYAPGSAIHVGGLEESEAVNLLHTVANIYPTSDTNSLEIVRELGMLAVAITQAGAFIHQTQRIDTYLEILHQHRSQLPSEPDSGDGPLTYAAFDLSFRQLPAKAQNFLKLCAFLHKSQIPVRLFEDSAKSDFITYTVHDYFPPPKSEKVFTSSIQEILGSTHDELPFHDVVDAASRASLIDISADGLFYTIQSPFQMYIKDHLAENEAHHYTHMMVQLLLGAIWPLDESNARFWRLLPHADAIPRAVQANDIAHALAFCQLYDSLGKWEACRELLEIALSQLQKTREETHAESIWLMSRLATMLLHCNRSEEAERMQQRILALQVDILGQQHPDTITTMNDLANTLYVRGRLQDAEELQRGVLALRLKILGQRHADTILTMSHLAATLHARGQWDKAETMQREVLDLRLQILGERSLDTVKAMSDLAATLSDSDQLDEAVEMERRVVGLQGDIAGKQHPNTIKAMGECAKILRKHGQLDEAEAVQRDISALSSGPSGRNPAM